MPGLRSLVARRRATLPTPETPQYSALYPVLPVNANSNSFQLASNSFNASVHPAAPASAPHGVSPLGGGPQNGSVAPSYNVYEPGEESGSAGPQSDQPMLYSSTEQQFSHCRVENNGHSKFAITEESKGPIEDLAKLAGHAGKHESSSVSVPSSWSGCTNLSVFSDSLQKCNEVLTLPKQSTKEISENISEKRVSTNTNKSKQQTLLLNEQPIQHTLINEQDYKQSHQIKLPLKVLSNFENKNHSEFIAEPKLQQHKQFEQSQHSLSQATPNQNDQGQVQPELQQQLIVEEKKLNLVDSHHSLQKPAQQQSYQSSPKSQQLDTVLYNHQKQKQQKNLYLQSQLSQPQQTETQQNYPVKQEPQCQRLPSSQSGKPNLVQASEQQLQFLQSSQLDVKVNVIPQNTQSNQHQQPLHSGQLLHFQSNQLPNFQRNQPSQLSIQQSNQQYIQASQQQPIQTHMLQELTNLQESQTQQQHVTSYQPSQQNTNQPTQQTQQVSIYPRTAYSAPPPTAFASNVYPHAALQGSLLYNSTLMAAAATPQTPATYLSINPASAPTALGYNTFGTAGPSLLLVPSQSTGYNSMPGYAQPAQTHSYLLPSQSYSSQPTLQTHFLAQPTQLVTAAAQPQQILFPQQSYQTQTQYQSSLYPSTAYAYSSPSYQSPSYQSPTQAYISPFQATVPDPSQQTIAAAPAIALQPTISLQAVAQPPTNHLGINPSPISSIASSSCLASVLQTVPQPSVTSLPSSIVDTSLHGGGTGNNTLLHRSAGNTAVVAGTNSLVLQSNNLNVACSLPGPIVPVNSTSILQRANSATNVVATSVPISAVPQFSAASAAMVLTTTQPITTFVASSPQSKSVVSTTFQMKVNSPRRKTPKKNKSASNANKKMNAKKVSDFQDNSHVTSISISNNMSYSENISVAVVSSELGSTCVPVCSFSNLSSSSFTPSDASDFHILANASMSDYGESRKSSLQISGLEDKIEAAEPFDLLLHLDALESLQNSMNLRESSLPSSIPNDLPLVRPNQPEQNVAQSSSGVLTQDVFEAKSTSMETKEMCFPDSSKGGFTELGLEVVKTEPESPTEPELKISDVEETDESCLDDVEQNIDMPVSVFDASHRSVNLSVTRHCKDSLNFMPDQKIMSADCQTKTLKNRVFVSTTCDSEVSEENSVVAVTSLELSTTETCASSEQKREIENINTESPSISSKTSTVEVISPDVDSTTAVVKSSEPDLTIDLTPPTCSKESGVNLPETQAVPKKPEVLPLKDLASKNCDRSKSIILPKIIQPSLQSADGDQNTPAIPKSNIITHASEIHSVHKSERGLNFTIEQNLSMPSLADSLQKPNLESVSHCLLDEKTNCGSTIEVPQGFAFADPCEKSLNFGSNLLHNEDNSDPVCSSISSTHKTVQVSGKLANASQECLPLISEQDESNANTASSEAEKNAVDHQVTSSVQNIENDAGVSHAEGHTHDKLIDDQNSVSPVSSTLTSLLAENDCFQNSVISNIDIGEQSSNCGNDPNVNNEEAWNAGLGSSAPSSVMSGDIPRDAQTLESDVSDSIIVSEVDSGGDSFCATSKNNIPSESIDCQRKYFGEPISVLSNAPQTHNDDVIREISGKAENLQRGVTENFDFPVKLDEIPRENDDTSNVIPRISVDSASNSCISPTANTGASKTSTLDTDKDGDSSESHNEGVIPTESPGNFDRSCDASMRPTEQSDTASQCSTDGCKIPDHSSNSDTNENKDSMMSLPASQNAGDTDDMSYGQLRMSLSNDCARTSDSMNNTGIEELVDEKGYARAGATDRSSISINNSTSASLNVTCVSEKSYASSRTTEDEGKTSLTAQACETSKSCAAPGQTFSELREGVTGGLTENVCPEPYESKKACRGCPKSRTGNQTAHTELKSQKCKELRSIRLIPDDKNLTISTGSTKFLRSQSRLQLKRLGSEKKRAKLQSPVQSPSRSLMKKFMEVRKNLNVCRAKRQLITSRAGLIVDRSLQVRQSRLTEVGSHKMPVSCSIADGAEGERLRDVRISRIRESTNVVAPSERIVLKMKLLSPNQKDKGDGKAMETQTHDMKASAFIPAASEWTIDNKTEIDTPQTTSQSFLLCGKWKTEAVKEGELKVKLRQEKSKPDVYKVDHSGGDAAQDHKKDNVYSGLRDSATQIESGCSQSSGSNSESASRRSSVDSFSSSRRSSQCSDVSEVSHYTDVSVASCSTNASCSSSGSEKGVQIVIKKLQDCEGYSCYRTKKKRLKLEEDVILEEPEDTDCANTPETGPTPCSNALDLENTKTCVPEVAVKDCEISNAVSCTATSSCPSISTQKLIDDVNVLSAGVISDERTPRASSAASKEIQITTQKSDEVSSCCNTSHASLNTQKNPKLVQDDCRSNTSCADVSLFSANSDQMARSSSEPMRKNNLLANDDDEPVTDNAARPKRKAALLSQEKCLVVLSKLDLRAQKKLQENIVGKNSLTESRASQSRKSNRSSAATEAMASSQTAEDNPCEVGEEVVPCKRGRGRPRLRDISLPGSALSFNSGVKRDSSLSPPRTHNSKKKLKVSSELSKSSNDSTTEPISVRENKDACVSESSEGDFVQAVTKNASSSQHLEALSNDQKSKLEGSYKGERTRSNNSEDYSVSKTYENDLRPSSSAATECDVSDMIEDMDKIDTCAEACNISSSRPSTPETYQKLYELPKVTASMIVMPLSAESGTASSPCFEESDAPAPRSNFLTSDHMMESAEAEVASTKVVSPTRESFCKPEIENSMLSCEVSLSNIFYDCELNHLSCPGCSESLPPQGIMVDVSAHMMHMLCFRCDWLVVRKLSLVDVCA